MSLNALRVTAFASAFAVLISLELSAVTGEGNDGFAGKLNEILQRAKDKDSGEVDPPLVLRTVFTDGELNSWLTPEALGLPMGIIDPTVSLLGDGRVMIVATINFEEFSKPSDVGISGPLSFLGGAVPIMVTGIFHSNNGQGRLEIERATIATLVISADVLQGLLAGYFKTLAKPNGINLSETFLLPAGIETIVIGEGRAVVVQ
jgi:hypothetical protein